MTINDGFTLLAHSRVFADQHIAVGCVDNNQKQQLMTKFVIIHYHAHTLTVC